MCDIVKDIFTQRTMTFSDFLIVFQLHSEFLINLFYNYDLPSEVGSNLLKPVVPFLPDAYRPSISY